MKNGLQILHSLNYWEKSYTYHQCWIYLMVKLSHIQLLQDQPTPLFQQC